MPEDEGKLSNGNPFPIFVEPGTLNPVRIKSSAPVIDFSKGVSPLDYIRKNTLNSYAGDSRQGTGPFKGYVLRENITNLQKATPSDGWLQRLASITNSEPPKLRSYSVYIPEFHSHLPTVTKTFQSNLDNQQDPEQRKIDLYPKFIAQSEDIPPAAPGDIVWVDYGNLQTFEDPIYLGPVSDKALQGAAGQGDQTGAGAAFGKPCGAPNGALKALPPTGEKIEEQPEASDEATAQIGSGTNTSNVEEPCLPGYNPTDQSGGVGDLTEPFPISQPKAKLVKFQFDAPRIGPDAGKQPSSNLELREDVANDLSQVKRILNELGAVLTTAGTGRKLGSSRGVPSSLHPLFMAIDLNTRNSSINVKGRGYFDYEYFLTKAAGSEFLFDIWARSDKPAGTTYTDPNTGATFQVEEKTLDVLVCRYNKGHLPATTEQYTGNVVPLTSVMKSYGFFRISPRRPWVEACVPKKLGKYKKLSDDAVAAEWWHFQSHRNLVQGQSKWGETARLVQDDQEVDRQPKSLLNRVFRGKGFSRR